jgi:hypothetical protein
VALMDLAAEKRETCMFCLKYKGGWESHQDRAIVKRNGISLHGGQISAWRLHPLPGRVDVNFARIDGIFAPKAVLSAHKWQVCVKQTGSTSKCADGFLIFVRNV